MIKILGHITLNISSMIYFIWLLPQIIHNFKRHSTAGLSIMMHSFLSLGCLADLCYGFGLNMPWQYRTVTLVSLTSLTVQHIQFGRYGLKQRREKQYYQLLSIIAPTLLIGIMILLHNTNIKRSTYDLAGMVANGCWLSYMLPQIIKNYTLKSTTGLSTAFVWTAIFLNSCDMISAWTLGWDYPSKIGPGLSFIGNFILLCQIAYYDQYHQIRTRLVSHC